MTNKICLKLFVFIFLISAFSSPANGFYKKKVLIGEIQNPVEWDKSYQPGNIIAELLSKELIRQKRVQLISTLDNSRQIMKQTNPTSGKNYVEPAIFDSRKTNFPDIQFTQNSEFQKTKPQQETGTKQIGKDPLWPSKLGRKSLKPNYFEIKGKVIKFRPDKVGSSPKKLGSLKSKNRENAEIEVYIELVQNSTGKTLYEKIFQEFSGSGTQSFTIEDLNSTDMNHGSSSMSFALNSLKVSLESFIHNKLDFLPLEGEIISTNMEASKNKDEKKLVQEEMLVNIGLSNGVSIGDLFKVDKVSLNLNDLYTARDLGNIYVKIGVIQILEVWEGTAKAIPLAGKNFETGFLVRSMPNQMKGGYSSINNKLKMQEDKKIPW